MSGTPTFVSCEAGSLSGTTPSPNLPLPGSQCASGGLIYDPGDLSFIASVGWDLALDLPPPPGGPDNTLGSAGEFQRFVISGLQESNFTPNLATQGPGGQTASGTYSCVHAQGLPSPLGSSRLCATLPSSSISSVPGPLPVLGAVAAFGYSRRIRSRIGSTRQQASIS